MENLARYVDKEVKTCVELIIRAHVLERITLCWLLRISVPNLENKQSSRKSRSLCWLPGSSVQKKG